MDINVLDAKKKMAKTIIIAFLAITKMIKFGVKNAMLRVYLTVPKKVI